MGHTAGPTASVEDVHTLDCAAAVLQLTTVASLRESGGAVPVAVGPSTPPTVPRVTGLASLPRRSSAQAKEETDLVHDASSQPKYPVRSPSTLSRTPTLNLSTLQLDARPSTAARSTESDALDSARRRAGAASAAAARLDGSGGAAYADPETARFGYREIRYEWRAHGVNPTCKELYLHDDEFARLFCMGKPAFYAQKQWQQRDAKQKLSLF